LQVIKNLAATTPLEEVALEAEWGRYRIQALSADVTGEGIMTNLTQRTTDPQSKKVVVAPVKDRRRWWANFMAQNGFPFVAKAARRLLAMHTTACAAERNWSLWGGVYTKGRNRLNLTLGEMIVFVKGNLRGAEGQDEEVLLRELYQLQPAEDGAAGAAGAAAAAAAGGAAAAAAAAAGGAAAEAEAAAAAGGAAAEAAAAAGAQVLEVD
jgi:hypothetical protein